MIYYIYEINLCPPGDARIADKDLTLVEKNANPLFIIDADSKEEAEIKIVSVFVDMDQGFNASEDKEFQITLYGLYSPGNNHNTNKWYRFATHMKNKEIGRPYELKLSLSPLSKE